MRLLKMIEMKDVIILCLVTFPWSGMGMKVLTFNESSELSSATLSMDNLPHHFLLCSSHTQQQINTPSTRTIYVLYRDSQFTKPWLSIGFWYCNFIPCLNVNVNFSGWYELGIVTREKFLNWVHICVEVDTVNVTLRAAVNGDVLKTVQNVHGLNPPHTKLNMRLGVVQDSSDRAPTQYIGSVSNVKIFNLGQRASKDILFSASGPSVCKSIDDSTLFLGWSDSNWNVVGKVEFFNFYMENYLK